MKVKIDKPIKLKGKYSVFVKCPYNNEILKVLQSFSGSYYHRDTNTWEFKSQCFKTIMDKCSFTDITICGDLPKEFSNWLDWLSKYSSEDLPYSSNTTPFQHQTECFNYAQHSNKFLLGDEQGLGKTKQAIDIATSRKHKMKHCLIVCGVNELKWNWLQEIKVHSMETGFILGSRINRNNKMVIGSVTDRLQDLKKPHDEFFIITNVETLRDKKVAEQIKKMCDTGIIGMTIIDEIHKCKNFTSSQGKAIHCCTSFYKLALTGTPLMNDAIDLYNILKWLEVENHTLTQFKQEYCVFGGYGDYQIVGYKNLDTLEGTLNDNMLRRKKEEVLDLPPKIYTDEYVEMSTQQQTIYNDVLNNIQSNIDKVMLNPNPLTELIRLRQVTSNPDILTTQNVSSVKYNRLKEIVTEVVNNGGKVIVFSNWSKVINPAYDLLKEFNPAIVTGEVKNTSDEITRFKQNNNCKVILGTISCLGTGFTLTEATTVVFLDEPWNMANKLQAEDRAHRIGTSGTVNIITLMCKDTIDERVHQLVKSKGELSDILVDGLTKDVKDSIYYLLS